ncbi:MAG: radical SAM protein [Planctomycetota bacterium]|jgi:MoaA/NifB/PqqE/SkfB family radical SAM enzyme
MDPTTAVVAVTLNCNARCVMCDIWQNRMTGEMRPDEYGALPGSLRDINISGGEPFLRGDLPEIVAVLRRACPRARLVISTNGFQPAKSQRLLREIVRVDPRVGLRVSIDGMGERHDEIRGVPGGFDHCLEVLAMARRLGVKDLGIGVTVMERNLDQLRSLYQLSLDHGLEFSVTIATDSEIYFGADQSRHRPTDAARMRRELEWLARREYRHAHPKRWFRAWFEKRLVRYALEGRRPFPCNAGRGFFYLDSLGTVYACHVRPLRMGNLRERSWRDVWHGPDAGRARADAHGCHDCWMVCTSKSEIWRRLPCIAAQVVKEKAQAHVAPDERTEVAPS